MLVKGDIYLLAMTRNVQKLLYKLQHIYKANITTKPRSPHNKYKPTNTQTYSTQNHVHQCIAAVPVLLSLPITSTHSAPWLRPCILPLAHPYMYVSNVHAHVHSLTPTAAIYTLFRTQLK